MEQFRLILGLGLVATQLGVAALLVVLFSKTRGERSSRSWVIATVATIVSTLISGFLPFGSPPLWLLYASALLTIAGVWMVWKGFRNYRAKPTSWWGWALPGFFLAAFLILPWFKTPQLVLSWSFTIAACLVLVLVAIEAVAVRESRARWLVVFAAVTNAASYIARPVLMAAGYEVGATTGNLPGLLSTYLIPIVDYFLLYAGLTLLAFHRLLAQKDALATLDELTQQPNRRALIETARREVRSSCRSGQPFSLMLVDIDHFKAVNDSSGHSVGDLVLIKVARALVAACRPTDLVSRYGGDEFVVLCPGLGSDQASALAQRLADAVRTVTAGNSSVTVSVGVAAFEECEEGSSWEAVFERADRALYVAKENGRNGVALG
jgi:diguanylate cyclase (GGDEF)-like protein